MLGLDRDLVLGAYGSTNILIVIIKATKKNQHEWFFMGVYGPSIGPIDIPHNPKRWQKNEMFGPMYIEAHHIFKEYPHQLNNLNQSYSSYTSHLA